MDELRFTFYGVRGSHPVSDKRFTKYGGNTTSLLFENGNDLFIIDSGTGIINAGDYIQKKSHIKKINIFLTHLHIDHIIGLPFFNPIYNKEMKVNIYCFKYSGFDFSDTIYSLFNRPLSPISPKGILADLKFFNLGDEIKNPVIINKNLKLSFIKDEFHPKSGVLIYRIDFFDKKIIFATDIESKDGFFGEQKKFINNADILIHDAQYTKSDYRSKNNPKIGYGHSTVDMALKNASDMNVKKLYLFHYNPNYSDRKLETILKYAKNKFINTYLSVEKKINKIRR